MQDWKDYIEQKFIPKEDYLLEYKYKDVNAGDRSFKIETIIITHNKTKTWFKFVNCYGTWTLLDHVWFGNPRTKCRPHIYYPIEFNRPTIEDVNNFLKPAFEGWSIEERYIFSKYVGSRYINNSAESHFLSQFDLKREDLWVWEKLGCIAGLLNMFGIINTLISKKEFGNVKQVVIEPINSHQIN
jgi:hypothetical protein